jgi:homoserine kinase type II
MACLTTLTLAEAKVLAAEYGLELGGLDALEAGSVNSNFRFVTESGAVFGRIYEEQGLAGAQAESLLLSELSGNGVPVSPPLRRLDGAVIGLAQGKPFGLYPWVVGEWLCHQRLTDRHCHLLGAALAQVHLSTARLTALPPGRFGLPQIRERLAFIRRTAPLFADAVSFIEAGIVRYEREAIPGLPRGLIHGDLFRDNVLWHQDNGVSAPKIAALLDFESASEGIFVYDLMVCVLAWCFTHQLDLSRVNALLDGYESLRTLSPAERQATTSEGMAVCLRFATTRVTDFAMRTPPGQTPKRDFKRFFERYEALEAGIMRQVWAERAAVTRAK